MSHNNSLVLEITLKKKLRRTSMSFYRNLLAAVAAVALATPAFAADDANATQPQQVADNTSAQTTDSSMTMQSGSTDQQSATSTQVNLNTATAKELMKIEGINATKAKNIVSYRKKHGDFKSVDELANVKGFKKMKPEMLKKIEDQLTIG
ncbi:MAG: helix-hairpin-helix domain-containing protein [Gammaproteobacteria bacterium]|nr:MAG: helix-hairpin-helix domain-containing protein [Gammaproteobacteria bacterium]